MNRDIIINNRNVITRCCLCMSLLMPLCTGVFAADTATLEFLGFSKDGKHAAFVQSGVHDGSGFAYGSVHIVNVVKNSYAVPVISWEEDDQDAGSGKEKNAYGKAMGKSKRELAGFGIVAGNKGVLVLKDPSKKKDASFEFFDPARKVLFTHNKVPYTLTLMELPAKQSGDECGFVLKTKMFRLELKGGSGKGAKTIVLQKDTNLPKSRMCAFSYGIGDVFVYQDRIGVFVKYALPGFEGADIRQVLVTGVIK
jgi:predicted secreted protein